MKQLTVISGKGGTGKTSVVASLATMAGKVVLADCDVDAADLHLVLDPVPMASHPFSGGKQASIVAEKCISCGRCQELCRFGAVIGPDRAEENTETAFRIDPTACEGCGVCAHFCPVEAILFLDAQNGEWFISETRVGPMVHAKLGIAEENSGKLVSLVREEARKVAQKEALSTIIIDGSPGIGCPVIASITGTDLALLVTEPTMSGLHDLERVADLTAHFNIPTVIAINKWDLNTEMTTAIKEVASRRELPIVGLIRYDRHVTEAQIRHKAVAELDGAAAAEDLNNLWKIVAGILLEQA
jgi:MinD superfamily P-loop ATPase